MTVRDTYPDEGADAVLDDGITTMAQTKRPQTTDRVQVHLEHALAATDAAEKNFHIRSALQSLLIVPDSPE